MKPEKISRPVKALGLCSGGLDSILSALVLKKQGIDVTWICFETPFFNANTAKKTAAQTRIPLLTEDITVEYMAMMKNPKAGFGKNMNPCMDCHALMFKKAGQVMEKMGFDFLFSGEVLGQRPKSQNKNSLRYVEKNSGFEGRILRPLSAQILPETQPEKDGQVDRSRLLDISGRSRKVQMALAKKFNIMDYPSPAGGCLLTDTGFSKRLKDIMDHSPEIEKRHLYYLKFGRHFRIDKNSKVIVGRSKQDNQNLMKHMDFNHDILVKHSRMAGPDVILTGHLSRDNKKKAAQICAAYTKAVPGEKTDIRITEGSKETIITVMVPETCDIKEMMV